MTTFIIVQLTISRKTGRYQLTCQCSNRAWPHRLGSKGCFAAEVRNEPMGRPDGRGVEADRAR